MRCIHAGDRTREVSIARAAKADRDGIALKLDAGTLLGLLSLFLMMALLVEPIAAKAEARDVGEVARAEVPSAMADSALTRQAPTPALSRTLDELLIVPRKADRRSDAQRADDLIAAAVGLGSNSDLVRPSAFRKRKLDLLRLERRVEIGAQEMLLKLRLRAKSRETMSVELRF